MGLSLGEIGEALAGLPEGHPGSPRLGRHCRPVAKPARSAHHGSAAAQEKLGACIGCGCLSLEHCALYNPDDQAAGRGRVPATCWGYATERAGSKMMNMRGGPAMPCTGPTRLHRQGGDMALEQLKRELELFGEQNDGAQQSVAARCSTLPAIPASCWRCWYRRGADAVLEIGTSSGFHPLAGRGSKTAGGRVTTIELDEGKRTMAVPTLSRPGSNLD